MELADIKTLIADFEAGSIRELNIEDGAFHLALSKNENATLVTSTASVAPTTMAAPAPITSAPVAVAPQPEVAENAEFIKAPLVGSVYLQPSEGVASFVEIGSQVEKGQTVAIIEAMKMMTEIKAPFSGKITDVLVKNEEIVEFDKPLFKVVRD
ncbi:acetyl-CoA carboxylase biotin carboxyl carrier protein [Periweissella fabaria]|uniref:Biotin carboxyl carrier protein of acetyl-CoA carboxylase n=1 Tax=Periweissella fabaria TaxID=546157 RepID=A0ABM8Z6N1_9LACO|nr:acetyl-CoA carboxylase biotin carboxyl carrier protein [Periweissella fabaria]MCM0597153.1 acetyl-CoA carboxylase biotin carboxyl carrier protein [Periweissella fabaria]CAH0417062.1 Biotin carboxyl carrier protein of acetyl-CoA carboxylase [Periweissella fabaria]